MESTRTQDTVEPKVTDGEVEELLALELALVGGGQGEVCF